LHLIHYGKNNYLQDGGHTSPFFPVFDFQKPMFQSASYVAGNPLPNGGVSSNYGINGSN
jgi:hypothetical protein